MSVEQAIIDCWKTYRTLSEKVPESRIWKGHVPQSDDENHKTELPYVSLLVDESESQRTNSNTITRAQLTMSVYGETEAQAEEIANEAREFFDGKDKTYSRGKITDMRWNGTDRVEDEEADTWHLELMWGVQTVESRSSL